jgi:hypothetical protein
LGPAAAISPPISGRDARQGHQQIQSIEGIEVSPTQSAIADRDKHFPRSGMSLVSSNRHGAFGFGRQGFHAMASASVLEAPAVWPHKSCKDGLHPECRRKRHDAQKQDGGLHNTRRFLTPIVEGQASLDEVGRKIYDASCCGAGLHLLGNPDLQDFEPIGLGFLA